jgi:hypothetical protein
MNQLVVDAVAALAGIPVSPGSQGSQMGGPVVVTGEAGIPLM